MTEREIKIVKPGTRSESQIKVREIMSHGLDCAYCPRDSMTITGDVITWKSPHGEDVHPNSMTIFSLLNIYVNYCIASGDKGRLKQIQNVVNCGVERLAA